MIGTGINFEGTTKPSSIEQDGYEPDLFAHRYCEIPTNLQLRLDYGTRTDGQPLYQGFAPRGLATSNDGWLLYKFTYDASNNMTLRQIAYNSWDLRADGGTVYA